MKPYICKSGNQCCVEIRQSDGRGIIAVGFLDPPTPEDEAEANSLAARFLADKHLVYQEMFAGTRTEMLDRANRFLASGIADSTSLVN